MAPDTGAKVMPSAEELHWYESPVATVYGVNDSNEVPLPQNDDEPVMVPAPGVPLQGTWLAV